MIDKNMNELFINNKTTVFNAIKTMDHLSKKLLIIVENNIYINLLSIGDIQRHIINGGKTSDVIENVVIEEKIVSYNTSKKEDIKETMLKYRMEFMPVLNNNNVIENILYWDDIFHKNKIPFNSKIDLPVVIMAGGYGSRLKPLTNVLPKPLIPISEKTIIEDIMDNFKHLGCNDFYLSIMYKADLIKYYLDSLNQYQITYFKENKPLGTAGSLSLIKNKINSSFFISNCDILIDQDLSSVYEFHKKNNYEITLISALKNISIPYGTLEVGENGKLVSLQEKPNLSFNINTGVYLLEPHLLDEIPNDSFFHITHLIEQILQRNGRVGVFPISEGSWTDIGDWNEYLKIIQK